MLKQWSIANFKSFNENVKIALAPITLFVGANSSGKSTIIQSILLLKQTLQYAPLERALALNGPLLKLGNFNDIKNGASKSSSLSVSFVIEAEQAAPFAARVSPGIDTLSSPYQTQRISQKLLASSNLMSMITLRLTNLACYSRLCSARRLL